MILNRYYSGEKVAPILTIFIGGNHEASNYLQELPYGGWVAPNIYYLGYAGVVRFNGVRIAGISGIYKSNDYFRGRFECPPYSENTKRSVYHQRQLDVFRLSQLTPNVDICLSHDWPEGVTDFGNVNQLIRFKPHFRDDINNHCLGSRACRDLLENLKPKYWFSAHLHCKFSAVIPHEDGQVTKFLALDKCLPRRRFLQILEIEEPEDNQDKGLFYDLEWLTVLFQTNSLLSVKPNTYYMPGPNGTDRYDYNPTEEEKQAVSEKFGSLKIPTNFEKIAPAYDPNDGRRCGYQPDAQINMQTTTFCDKLGIDDPLSIVLLLAGKDLSYSSSVNSSMNSTMTASFNDSLDLSQGSPSIRPPMASALPLPMWIDKGRNTNPEQIDLDEDEEQNESKEDEEKQLIQEFTAKYSTPFKSSTGSSYSSTPRTKLVLPSPKFDDLPTTESTKVGQETVSAETLRKDETPLTKKFKRRNQEIYATPD